VVTGLPAAPRKNFWNLLLTKPAVADLIRDYEANESRQFGLLWLVVACRIIPAGVRSFCSKKHLKQIELTMQPVGNGRLLFLWAF
jgi:hypothetical protein